MFLQNTSRKQIGYGVFKTVFNGFRFSTIRYRTDYLSGFHDLIYRHRNSPFGHIADCFEPSLPELLSPAIFIQLNDYKWIQGFEISRRIVSPGDHFPQS